MIRLNIVVEGQTEEEFVNEVLCDELATFDIFTSARRVQTSRKKGIKHSGGGVNRSCEKLIQDLMRWINEDKQANARFSMMIDYYGLATDCIEQQLSMVDKTKTHLMQLEDAFATRINDRRFIPYLQYHEFEGLLFTDPDCFLTAYPRLEAEKIQALHNIRAQFATPEEINNSPETAPSKRIMAIIHGYDKIADGNLIALEIGFQRLYAENPHFAAWIDQIKTSATKPKS